ncbi:hypothetical protein EYF80_040524 [Liparis tanakae]|uniref:Uncharacterized protein n=1 Tax=Liparis tanakae TaxID=230148 RepID=A0A4Z2G6V5_9TELE|nr:hypothetical protein EYF80_040524 [Liparis tanakae]
MARMLHSSCDRTVREGKRFAKRNSWPAPTPSSATLTTVFPLAWPFSSFWKAWGTWVNGNWASTTGKICSEPAEKYHEYELKINQEAKSGNN